MTYSHRQVKVVFLKGYNNGFKDGLEYALLFPDDILDALELVNGR